MNSKTSTTGNDSSQSSTAGDILLSPFKLNEALELPNRILMAPMTRSMADDDLVPTEEMAAYYARRADAGLIITEGTIIRPDGQGYPNVPGIFNTEQVAGWRRVADAVHQGGGLIFIQIWHVGRVSHPTYLGGDLPIAPSAVTLSGRVPRSGGLEYGTPRALAVEEIPALVTAYAKAAVKAREAGADGVEIHGANGYLIDQFLHHHTNRRTDEWGGPPQRMAGFALEVVDAVADAIGSERTGLRLSPGAYFNMEASPGDAEVFTYLLAELEGRKLAYVHTGIFDDRMEFEELGGSAGAFLRENYRGTLVGAGSYLPEDAARAIDGGAFELVSIGRPFIANPDLIERIRQGQPLEAYDEAMLRTLR